jgi:hypothetical protein
MTTVVVLATPPIEGECLEELQGPLAPAEATALYRAMLADVCETVLRGGADLLVNYPDADEVPGDVEPEAALRELLDDELPAAGDVRYEVQVGETHAGRVGNAVTHLLENENEATVAAVEPTAPFLRREHVGNAAMKLRSSEVVLGPATDGRVYFAGFREPIDFQDAYAAPAVETLTGRAVAAGHDVDFLPTLPLVEAKEDLSTALPLLSARRSAGRIVPTRTAETLSSLDPVR